MGSKTKQSGRVDILLRMEPGLKARLVKAANHHGISVNDWLLDGIEHLLAVHDGEVAAEKRKADLERRRELKFDEIVLALAGSELAGLSADKVTDLHYVAEAAIEKWRNRTASNYYAEPKTPLERLCKEHEDIETKLEGAQRLDTFGDEGLGYDPDDPDDDGDEPEPEDELVAPGDPDDGE